MPGKASTLRPLKSHSYASLILLALISAVPSLAQSPGDLKWVAPIANGQIFSSPSIAADGTIYVGHSGSWPGLYAINPDGTQKWYFKPYSEVWTAPAIGSDGTIYFGTEGGEELVAVNPDGTEKWVLELFGEIFGSPAIGQDGTIYVGLDRPENDSFYAINPNGTVRWSLDTGYNIYSAPAIAPDGTIYVSQEEAFILLALRPDGSSKWSTDLPGGTGFYPAFQSSPALGIDGAIYIGGGNGNLYAVNPDDGSIRWAYDTGAKIIASPAIGTDGTIYVGSWNGILSAVNPDGTSKWDFATGNEIDSTPAIGRDGSIYFASRGGLLWAVNPDGTEKWQGSIGGNPFSSPTIGSDGTVYVGGYSNLYAFYSDSLGLAQSPWPAYRQDVERTGRGEFVPVPLTLGVPLQTGIEAGQAHYYSLETEADDSVLVQVTADSGITSLALHGQYEGLTYQTTTATPHGTWELNLAPTVGGQYLLMVYGTDVAGAGGVFTILADSVARHVSDVDPREAGNAGLVSVLISGLGFEEGMDVELSDGGPTLSATEVTTSSQTELLAQFDLSGAALGAYNLTVVWPDVTSQSLTDAFEIVAGSGPELEAHLEAPEAIRPETAAIAWLVYRNVGDADMPAPLFTVRSNVFISLDGGRTTSTRVEILGIGDSSDPAILRVGESRRIPVYFRSPKNPDASTFFTLAVTEETSQAIDWESQKYVMKPTDMTSGEWDVLWPDLIARLGSTWAEYLATLRMDALRLGARGLSPYDVSELINLELSYVTGNPVTAISGVLLRADTLEPLPGVTVRARSTNGLIVAEAVTAYQPPGNFVLAGLPDTTYDIFAESYLFDPAVQISLSGTDVLGLELLAQEIPDEEAPTERIVRHRPFVVADAAQALYLFWDEDREIHWAINRGSGWESTGTIPEAEGVRPVATFDPELLDGGLTPGLLVAWETTSLPSTIEWSAGRFESDTISWTVPATLTSDSFGDAGISVVLDDLNQPLVLWLQRDSSLADDFDLYFSEVDLSEALESVEFTDQTGSFSEAEICIGGGVFQFLRYRWELDEQVSGPMLSGRQGFLKILWMCGERDCTPDLSHKLPGILLEFGSLDYQPSEGLSFDAHWTTDPCECRYVFDEARLTADISQSDFLDYGEYPVVLKLPEYVPESDRYWTWDILWSVPDGNISATGNLRWKANFPDYWDPSSSWGQTVSGDVTGQYVRPEPSGLGPLDLEGYFYFTWQYRPPPDPAEILGMCHWNAGEGFRVGPLIAFDFCQEWGDCFSFGCENYSPGASPSNEVFTIRKSAFVGTASTYEGTPVLGDISGDLYDDGLASAARSQTGETLIVWSKDEEASLLGSRIWTTTYAAPAWSTPTSLTPAIAFHQHPAVAFDASGNPMAVWSSAPNAGLDWDTSTAEEILLATELSDIVYSQRVGDVWSAPAILASLPGIDEQTVLAAGPTGQLTAAWLNQVHGSFTIYAAHWNGSSWSSPVAVATPALVDQPVVRYFGTAPRIFWSQDVDGDIDTYDSWNIYSSFWKGSAWSEPEPLDLPVSEASSANTGMCPDPYASSSNLLTATPPPACCDDSCDEPAPADPPPDVQEPLDNAACENVASADPNEKLGTPGAGPDRLVEAGDRLSYSVYFENLPAATAPAQEVFVTDCLSTDLDWLSVQLNEFAFGDVILTNPGEGASFKDRVTIPDYRGTGDQWWVEIDSQFNFITGCLTVTFRTIDLSTGELPSDPFAGFLPPENGTGRGQGHIGLSVDSLGDLADGTLITNDASIVFDTNEPIVTNEVFNTIGTPSGSYTLTVSIAGPGDGTVTSIPAGIDCGSDCSESYPAWTQVGLVPHPGPKMKLTGWSGDADCDGGVVTLDHNTSCTAAFGPDPEVFSDGFESGDTLDWSITRQ